MTGSFMIFSSACFLISSMAFFFLRLVVQQEKLSRRLDRATGSFSDLSEQKNSESLHLRLVAGMGFVIARSGLINKTTIDQIRHTLRISGIRDKKSFGVFLGVKFILFISFPVLAFIGLYYMHISHSLAIFLIVVLAVCGLLLPDFTISQRRKGFIKRLESGLADTLDMMVICADAGLSLEAALARVAHEIRGTHSAVADELTITSHEMRIGSDVREALTGLGARTNLDGLKRFGSTLVQTIQYGTPLTQALRILSAELRQEQLTRFEERAARLPVLLTVPMIVFILPCVFLVVGGPAILKVMDAFAHR